LDRLYKAAVDIVTHKNQKVHCEVPRDSVQDVEGRNEYRDTEIKHGTM
jgi:hypothetical protein